MSQIPESMNWADYCDALRAEGWLRRASGAEQSMHTGPRAKLEDKANKSTARETALESREDKS
jgi:hypothetical protein